MTTQNKLQSIGATPGKLALIAVLSLVLVAVIFRQLPSRQATPQTTPVAAKEVPQRNAQVVAQQTSPEPSATDAKQQPKQTWPEAKLEDFLTHDPFRTPAWALRKPEPTRTADTEESSRLDELQKQGVSIVMIAEEAKSARIGDYRVHVGDVLEGYQITDITSQGVVLNKLETH